MADLISPSSSPPETRPPQILERWLSEVTPRWRWDWKHLVAIREQLDRVTSGEIRKLMIAAPPRHGKSEKVSIRYPVFRMEEKRDLRVAVGAYNQEFANKFGRRTRRLARMRFPIAERERAAAREWETPEEGMFRSCSVGAPPTGDGFHLFICDDPIKSRDEAESAAYREAVWEWYAEDIQSRLEPDAAQIVTMHRWHEDDLAGRLIETEGDQWTVLTLPALAEENDPLGRAVGEALWPERYPREALEKLRLTMGEYAFRSRYQNRPSAREGSQFKVGMLKYVDAKDVPVNLPCARGYDFGYSEGGDQSASVRLEGPDPDGLIYVTDAEAGAWDSAERNKRFRATAGGDREETLHCGPQDPAAGKETAGHFVTLLGAFRVRVRPVRGSKEIRADAFASQLNAGKVRVVRGAWNRAWVEELRLFPGGGADDQVDATSEAYAGIVGMPDDGPRSWLV